MVIFNSYVKFVKLPEGNLPVLFCDPVYLSYFQALVRKHGRQILWKGWKKMEKSSLNGPWPPWPLFHLYTLKSLFMVDFPASHGRHGLLRKSHVFQCQVEAQNHSNPINHSYIFVIVPIWLGESNFIFTFIFTIPDCFPWLNFARDVPYLRIFSRFSNSNFEVTKEELPELLGYVAAAFFVDSQWNHGEIMEKSWRRTEVASAFSWWRQKLEIGERKLMEVDENGRWILMKVKWMKWITFWWTNIAIENGHL